MPHPQLPGPAGSLAFSTAPGYHVQLTTSVRLCRTPEKQVDGKWHAAPSVSSGRRQLTHTASDAG
jgi:hypothetical protein